MIAVDYTTAQKNFEDYCERITDYGETVFVVTKKEEENVVMLSGDRYRELERAEKNLAYFNKLEKSLRQMESGEAVHITMDELDEMVRNAV